MMRKNAHIYGTMLFGIIVIATFVYGVEIQPVVTANSELYDIPIAYNPTAQLLHRDILSILTPNFATGISWWPSNYLNTCKLKTFSSYEELGEFFSRTCGDYSTGYLYCEDKMVGSSWSPSVPMGNGAEMGRQSIDFSETNIQVEGVDEPDFVKTDGTYLYIVQNSKISYT